METFHPFNPVIHPPTELHLEITSECNLRCKQCHLWMSREGPNSLSTDEKLDLIRQYYLMNPRGFVILSGGEPLAKQDEFFAITRLCRSVGMRVLSTVNGSYLNEEVIDRIFIEGPNIIAISLDSHKEEIHDYIRGVKGSFNHIVSSIKKMIATRSERFPFSDTHITTNSILFDKNIEHWLDYMDFAKNVLKVDSVNFQMLSRTFYNRGKGDHFFDKHFFKDVSATKLMIDKVKDAYGNSLFMRTTSDDLDWMKLYVENPDFIGEQVCGSHERNIMISQYGHVQLCHNMRDEVTNGKPIGNIREESLKDLWTGEFSEDVRELMSSCRKNCGMLNCHRKL